MKQVKVGDKVRYKAINKVGRVSQVGSKRFPNSIEVRYSRSWAVTLHPGEWEFA